MLGQHFYPPSNKQTWKWMTRNSSASRELVKFYNGSKNQKAHRLESRLPFKPGQSCRGAPMHPKALTRRVSCIPGASSDATCLCRLGTHKQLPPVKRPQKRPSKRRTATSDVQRRSSPDRGGLPFEDLFSRDHQRQAMGPWCLRASSDSTGQEPAPAERGPPI